MPYNRYYINSELQQGDLISLKEDEWHHLSHVSRGRLGECVEIINGRGKIALASIQEISKKEGVLLIKELIEEQPPPPQVILALALSRMNHLEWAIEKSTELGASAFWLFPGMLSEKSTLSDNQHVRLNALILAATKQCGRLHLPTIECKPPLMQWSSINGSLFVCNPSDKVPYLWDIPNKKSLQDPKIFFIGPEKGLDAKELEFLQTHLGAQEVRLHKNILRTETAPLVALSLIQLLNS